MDNLLKKKLDSNLVIFDGAMGTEIYRRNYFVNSSYEQLCLTRPEVIQEIHQQYLDAGAEILTTNTYNANSRRLGRFGLADKTVEINRAGVAIAKKVANDKALVAASVGPVGAPESSTDNRTSVELLLEQLSGLTEADFVIFESLRTTAGVLSAIEAISEIKLPYILSLSLESNVSHTPEDAIEKYLKLIIDNSKDWPPTAIGLNCGGGPENTLFELEKLMRLKPPFPVIVQPNAGAPRDIDGRRLYMTNGEYLSTYAKRYAELGAKGIGGCCGITPSHIAELVRTVKPLMEAEKHTITIAPKDESVQVLEILPLKERSDFGRKLAEGKFIKMIEITPPAGFDLTKVITGAQLCSQHGIDAVNLPDGPRASARMTPMACALAISNNANITPIPHCCCRDRSLIGLQAELLSYAALGINNLLFITGDPPKLGDYPFSTGVFDTDAIGLTKLQKAMNQGIDLGGKPLGQATKVVIGVGLDPNAIDPEREYRRICEKVAAGADFIVTQPVFAPEKLIEFLDRIAHLKTPVIAGIWPLTSLRNAQFMKTEVPGVVMPDEIMERMASAKTKEEQKVMGVAIARESLAKVRPYISGVQVSAPFGNVQLALDVLA